MYSYMYAAWDCCPSDPETLCGNRLPFPTNSESRHQRLENSTHCSNELTSEHLCSKFHAL